MAFELTSFGEICSDTGNQTIVNLAVCKRAAVELGKIFNKEGSWWDHPTGCCLNINKVYWNTHVNGDRHNNTQEICLVFG